MAFSALPRKERRKAGCADVTGFADDIKSILKRRKHMKLKSKKSALLLSFTSLLLCFAMLAGSTFAWFTDTATTGVNQIKSGKLDVDIVDENNNSLDGKSLSFKNANGEDDILWEPGATFFTQGFKIVNKGNLALKYKVVVSGTTGDAKLLKAIKFDVVTEKKKEAAAALTEKGGLLPNGASAPAAENTYYYLRGHMNETANNDYQDLSLNGISITVYATQDTVEYDSFNNTYDEKAGKDTAFYSLADFNALTEIPEGVKTVYVDLGGASLEGGLTVGSDGIADHYCYTDWNQGVAPEGYPTKVGTDNRASDGAIRYIYSTGKPAINVILTGAVLGAKDTGEIGLTGKIALKVPDAANVTFSNVTFGEGQMTVSAWTETGVASMTVDHHIASVTFDKCTFKGNWLQNGAVNAGKLLIKDCTFEKYINTKKANNSNPIWIQNLGKCDATVEGCTINAVRPIKLWEGNANGTVTIKNNTFNMSKCSIDNNDTHKNIGVMFCKSTLDNVVVSGNTVKGDATALICFYDSTNNYPTLNGGATFKLSGNNMLDGALESVLWKTATEWTPNYVTE